MSYFLKQTKIKNRIFLQISETTYNKENKKCSNKVYKKIGFLDELSKVIDDPINFYKEEINKLNNNYKSEKEKEKKLTIHDRKETIYGHFLIKGLLNYLNLKEKAFQYLLSKHEDTRYYEIFESLLFARTISRDSIKNNYNDAFDNIYNGIIYNEKDVIDTLTFVGNNFSEIVEILNKQINEKFTFKNNYTFFDSFKCIIDVNKKDSSCITQGILLNEQLIPCALFLFNNQDAITQRKFAVNYTLSHYPNTRIVRVADRGINYSNNVYNAILHKTGYIFPLSLSSLLDNEKEWILDKNNYSEVRSHNNKLLYKVKTITAERYVNITKNDGSTIVIKEKQKRVASFDPALANKKKEEIYSLVETAKTLFYSNASKVDYGKSFKYIKVIKQEGKPDKIEINEDKIDNELKYAGYKLIVTNDDTIKKNDLFNIYDTVWRIEDYFRFLRNQLNINHSLAENLSLVYGHYVLGYFIIALFRILENCIFNNEFSFKEIADFIRDAKILEINDNYINLLSPSKLLEKVKEKVKIDLDLQYFNKSDLNKMFKISIK